jgi:dipeptidyl aminopeptidase/acylaminoacyl peptidase
MQSTFFHHALVSLLAQLAGDGLTASCLNPPGSTGGGRRYREPERPWSVMAYEAISERTHQLRQQGIERIGIVTGSLGTLPVLRLLGSDTITAALLVSPVFSHRIAVLQEWGHLFDEITSSTAAEILAQRIRAPLMIVHGLRDEMAQTGQTSRFLTHVPDGVACDYITFPDEGHIFAQPESWEQTLTAGTEFLRHHLLGSD